VLRRSSRRNGQIPSRDGSRDDTRDVIRGRTHEDAGTEAGSVERTQRGKLRETRETYQQALHDAFNARCTTQTEANDVVVNENLSGYAQNAFKKYVPQLTTTYNAGELHDEHPLRFTNEGLRRDPKPENAIEWYVKVPHHEDHHLRMPAQPNPEQRDSLESVERW
jgi:hypothetical protein